MLVLHKRELDARLPSTVADMDIRDLVKSEVSHPSIISSIPNMSSRREPPSNGQPSSGSFSLPHPVVSNLQYGMHASTESSSFSRPSPLEWHSNGGYYVEAPQGPPLPLQQPLPQKPHFKLLKAPPQVWPKSCLPNKRSSPSTEVDEGPPTKKSSTKWNVDENKRIIALRGQGMKWSDISRHIPGRTELACRLHYQNYLEKRGDWDEEKKNKLARVYERYASIMSFQVTYSCHCLPVQYTAISKSYDAVAIQLLTFFPLE